MAVQPSKVRNGVSSCRRRHANVPVYISARAATTMTPAAVVTAEPPKPSGDTASAAMLGPLGKSLLDDAEVRTYVWVHVLVQFLQNLRNTFGPLHWLRACF